MPNLTSVASKGQAVYADSNLQNLGPHVTLHGLISELMDGVQSTGGITKLVAASFTRPNDITAYAANDAVNDSVTTPTALNFSGAARVTGGTGVIASLRASKNSATTTNASFRLHLYRSDPSGVATLSADNAQFALFWTARLIRLGFVDFTFVTAGTGSDMATAIVDGINRPYVCTGTSLYGRLQALSAYTPTANEIFHFELGLLQD